MFEQLKSKAFLRPSAVHACGAAIGLALVALAYQCVYAPMRREIDDRKLRIESITGLAARGEAVSRDHREMKDRLSVLTAAAAHTRRRMPKELSAGDFVEQMTRLAAELDLEVEQCQTGPPQIQDTHATIEVSCRLVGSYASMCRYLAAVDQLPQISNVWRLEVTRTPDPKAYPVQVTFQLYYQVDPHDKDHKGGIL
jgi:Tfp pilus assembly protein PilO